MSTNDRSSREGASLAETGLCPPVTHGAVDDGQVPSGATQPAATERAAAPAAETADRRSAGPEPVRPLRGGGSGADMACRVTAARPPSADRVSWLRQLNPDDPTAALPRQGLTVVELGTASVPYGHWPTAVLSLALDVVRAGRSLFYVESGGYAGRRLRG